MVIETYYNGYRFRSRLEARWAVFFNIMGIHYEYEREGFQLKDGSWFLPDFWLTQQQCWVEIKPLESRFYNKKCDLLAQETNNRVLFICGTPFLFRYMIDTYGEDNLLSPEDWGQFATGRRDDRVLWVCGGPEITENIQQWGICLNPEFEDGEREPLLLSDKLKFAYLTATQMRFEYEDKNDPFPHFSLLGKHERK